MNILPMALLASLAALGLSACKVVKTVPAATAGGALSADDARIAGIIAETLHSQLIPHITARASALPTLRSAVAAGLNDAGRALGNRGAGDGAAWSFAVTGKGRVIAANLTSRARKAELDTDGDGAADLTLQLGPVIKGTGLRDVAPFYDFNDFKDQIEFAKLGRAINDAISGTLKLPEGDLLGKTLDFTGVVTLASATDSWLVTAIKVSE